MTDETKGAQAPTPGPLSAQDWDAIRAHPCYGEHQPGCDCVIPDQSLAPTAPVEAASGHTDLMVSPESIDAFLDANPLAAAPMGYCKHCNGPRAVSPCHKCGGELQPAAEGWEWPELPSVDRIRELAREVGYGIGVHGSLERDLDLIAIPWIADAVSPPELAAHIAEGLPGQVLDDVVQDKPSGRWSCNINPEGWFKMIDLSVMPPMPTQPNTAPVEASGSERKAKCWVLQRNDFPFAVYGTKAVATVARDLKREEDRIWRNDNKHTADVKVFWNIYEADAILRGEV